MELTLAELTLLGLIIERPQHRLGGCEVMAEQYRQLLTDMKLPSVS